MLFNISNAPKPSQPAVVEVGTSDLTSGVQKFSMFFTEERGLRLAPMLSFPNGRQSAFQQGGNIIIKAKWPCMKDPEILLFGVAQEAFLRAWGPWLRKNPWVEGFLGPKRPYEHSTDLPPESGVKTGLRDRRKRLLEDFSRKWGVTLPPEAFSRPSMSVSYKAETPSVLSPDNTLLLAKKGEVEETYFWPTPLKRDFSHLIEMADQNTLFQIRVFRI